ncbi:hypothetical protein SAMN05444678_102256 [Sphingomonas sp. YR710]|uniref:hypothetical protein n=1 Tax=Sphingomonas sp. YR710 TaxID=1882773 RepID=UPI00088ECE27|nr:hypothetical protein [Sphingomonas sp. YR710]SDC30651.1 hypothetical protein SAMN05444678_102256 [Sphingomonas sp. YR710]
MIRKTVAFLRRNGTVIARDLVGLAGVMMISGGAAAIYEPAGWIVGGAMLLAAAWRLS